MIRYHAAWIVPIAGRPVPDGWVMVDDGRIVALGDDSARNRRSAFVHDMGSVAIMPGLVNAHTHLELSYLRDEILPASSFVAWVRSLIEKRRPREEQSAADILEAVDRAIAEAVASGTAVVGDISNTLNSLELLARSPLVGTVFLELIRFRGAGADRFVDDACRRIDALASNGSVRVSLAAHAPYSVSPDVFRAIRRAVDDRSLASCSVHLAEAAEETEFVARGAGEWRRFLEELGSWDQSWIVPGISPVQYLEDIGFLDERVIAVHGVQMTADDLARLARRGVTLVTCPRSNRHTGAGVPPLDDFYASGVRIAVGTDSLASAPDLNLFAELAAMRALATSVPAGALLDSATRQGARALGFDSEYGTIEPGKRARLLAVDIPPQTDDVEEYLVSGIRPEQVRWIQT
jgi:cytosine/adenosine deaminase-related metal-dependent hydrolase